MSLVTEIALTRTDQVFPHLTGPLQKIRVSKVRTGSQAVFREGNSSES